MSKHYYPTNPEHASEMIRLLHQGRLARQADTGVLVENPSFEGIASVLDIACGPGTWILETAEQFPSKKFMGIDISERMIQFARAQAVTNNLHNTDFVEMDILQPLNLPDASFDLVNARFLISVLQRDRWPSFLAECKRVLRPGGMIRLTEGEAALVTNSLALETLSHHLIEASFAAEQGFSRYSNGIMIRLTSFLRETGFEHVKKRIIVNEFGLSATSREAEAENIERLFKNLKSFIIARSGLSEETFDTLYLQAKQEIHDPLFEGLGVLISASGRCPNV